MILSMWPGARATAQSNVWTDSLKKNLSNAQNDLERVQAMLSLSMYFNTVDDEQSERYARQAIETAELSRNRKLMVAAYRSNGNRFMNAGLSNQLDRALENFRQEERIARENGLEDELVKSYCDLARAFNAKGDNVQALQFSNLAVATASGRDADTVKVQAYLSLGDTYAARNEKLLAFRNYLQGSDIAELSKNGSLIHNAYLRLGSFYASLPDEDDKAIDYVMKAIDINRKSGTDVSLLGDYNYLGDLFAKQEKYDVALKMYERSIALADTMHFELFKINSYVNIFTMYFKAHQFRKGVDYLERHPAVMEVVHSAGIQFFVDKAYGSAYSDQNRWDSAAFYFRRAEPLIEKKVGALARSDFYVEVGNFYKRKGDNADAIVYYQKARVIGDDTKSLAILQNCDANLDTLYARAGDYKTARIYNAEYGRYSDSIRSLARVTDLDKLEVENDNRRRERLARDEELNTEHRHNVQYMGFTIGLVVLFLSLVMLGWFVVSPRTIRALGFFSFIFLFEFIILLADKQIHEWTHGEPWKILAIKIALAAILLPLHHWLEHKVIHYLTSHKKDPSKAPGTHPEPVTITAQQPATANSPEL